MADVRSERERMESELHRSSADEKIVFGKKGFSKYDEISVAETLRSSGGDIGGGQREPCPSWDKTGALCATDCKWIQQQQVVQGKIIPVRVIH